MKCPVGSQNILEIRYNMHNTSCASIITWVAVPVDPCKIFQITQLDQDFMNLTNKLCFRHILTGIYDVQYVKNVYKTNCKTTYASIRGTFRFLDAYNKILFGV